MTSTAGDPRGLSAYKKLRAVMRKARLPCAICHQPIDYTADSRRHPRSFTVDHIVAIKDGGSNDSSNCRAACRGCNQARNRKRHSEEAERKRNAERRRHRSREW